MINVFTWTQAQWPRTRDTGPDHGGYPIRPNSQNPPGKASPETQRTGADGATATGGTVTAAGGTLNGTGTAINLTAKTLTAAGKGLKIATTATNGVVHGVQGKWDKVAQDAAGFTVNLAGTTAALGGLGKNLDGKLQTITNFADKHKNLLSTAQDAANTVKDGIKTYQDIRDGKDLSQIAIDGISALSYGTGAAGLDNISDLTNGLSYGIATAKDAANGEYVDAGLNALSALASTDAVHTRHMADKTDSDNALGKYLSGAAKSESTLYKVSGKIQNVYDNWFKSDDSQPTSAPMIVQNYNNSSYNQDTPIVAQNTSNSKEAQTPSSNGKRRQELRA